MQYQKECNSHIPKRQPVPHTTTRTIEESKRNNKKNSPNYFRHKEAYKTKLQFNQLYYRFMLNNKN